MRRVLAFCLCLLPLQGLAHEKINIVSMAELKALESRLPTDHRQTLFVFDIDNTLLRTKQDLGGDAWFTWQETLLKTQPGHADLVAPDFAGLITVQGWLFSLGTMRPPEPETPTLFMQLQNAGYPILLLTSRSADFENQTQRELTRNQYQTRTTALAPRAGFAGPFIPYDVNRPERSCLTPDDVQRLNLPPAQAVVYRDGVMFSRGQHKGAMLRTLLCKLNRTFSHIVFVDDHQKHVDRVYSAFELQPGEVLAVKYSQMDAEVRAFHLSDKALVREQWLKLKQVLNEIF